MSDVTNILTAIEQGDRKAAGELLQPVYEELSMPHGSDFHLLAYSPRYARLKTIKLKIIL